MRNGRLLTIDTAGNVRLETAYSEHCVCCPLVCVS